MQGAPLLHMDGGCPLFIIMSLKFFFNRNGRVVWLLTFLGWGLSLWNGLQLKFQWELRGEATDFSFLFFVFFYLLILGFRFIPWYKKEDRGYGIEEHFFKSMVPAAYILVVTNGVYIFWAQSWPFLLFSVFLLSILLLVNFILIYFHFRDHDLTPPAYFARSLNKRGSA